MKLPSHLAKSRHGVYYFRLTIRAGAVTREKRWSLNTRDPAEAKVKALYVATESDNGPVAENPLEKGDMLVNAKQGVRPDRVHGLRIERRDIEQVEAIVLISGSCFFSEIL